MIRKAITDDALRIAEIYVSSYRNAFYEFIPEEFLYKKLNVPQKIVNYDKQIRKDKTELLVYEENGLVFGFIHCGICENIDIHNGYMVYDLFVETTKQNTGIGKLLMIEIEKIAKKENYNEIILWTFEKNLLGISFYEKLGYKIDTKEEYLDYLKSKEIRLRKKIV